jgi:hypothetical protein
VFMSLGFFELRIIRHNWRHFVMFVFWVVQSTLVAFVTGACRSKGADVWQVPGASTCMFEYYVL